MTVIGGALKFLIARGYFKILKLVYKMVNVIQIKTNEFLSETTLGKNIMKTPSQNASTTKLRRQERILEKWYCKPRY